VNNTVKGITGSNCVVATRVHIRTQLFAFNSSCSYTHRNNKQLERASSRRLTNMTRNVLWVQQGRFLLPTTFS